MKQDLALLGKEHVCLFWAGVPIGAGRVRRNPSVDRKRNRVQRLASLVNDDSQVWRHGHESGGLWQMSS